MQQIGRLLLLNGILGDIAQDQTNRKLWAIDLLRSPFLKPLLLLAYLACDAQAIAGRLDNLGVSAGLIVYLGLYAILASALIAAAWLPRFSQRVILALPLVAGSIALHSYEWATGAPLDYSSFEMMLASAGDAGDAASQHGATLGLSLASALLLVVALLLPPAKWRVPPVVGFGLPVAALGILSVLFYLRGGEGGRALPAPFIPLAHASIMGALELTEEGADRKPVAISPTGPTPNHDIVLIVDESIAANYLDIVHPKGVYSALGVARPGLGVHNFGVAAAANNCSPGSNKTLRFGGTRENYRRMKKTEPSIWAFARKAGLRTVYLDGQRKGGELHNLMDEAERAEIQDFVQLDGMAVVERDQKLARFLAERLANGVREFIYVNKVGAHFPVADKFPESAARFRPLPARGGTDAIVDMGPIHGSHRGTAEEWRLYRNAYRNTIIWNVGSFFDALLRGIDPEKAVILYTSDHGQDLHERGNPGKTTHCINDPLMEEGAVPLVVLDSARKPRLGWAGAAKTNRNGMSHYRIFPTLLSLMGYAEKDVRPGYGPSLIAPDKDPMTFNITYFAALGKEPTWRKVDVAKLTAPPDGDFTPIP